MKTEVPENIVERIRKLLNRTEANGCTAHEAETALRLANELMEEHSLAMADVDTPEAESYIVEGEVDPGFKQGRPKTWAIRVAASVATIFGVTAHQVKRTGRNPGETVRFYGTKTDVEVASLALSWLIEQGRRLVKEEWKSFQRLNPWTSYGTFETSFLYGYQEGIQKQSFRVAAERRGGKIGEIIAVKEDAIREYIQERGEVLPPMSSTPVLDATREAIRPNLGALPSHLRYHTALELVAELGDRFSPVVDERFRGPLRGCYRTAGNLAIDNPKRFVYVEGFAVSSEKLPLPIAHAWVYDLYTRVAIETTWEEPGVEYLGVPFLTEWLRAFVLTSGNWGVLDCRTILTHEADPARYVCDLRKSHPGNLVARTL